MEVKDYIRTRKEQLTLALIRLQGQLAELNELEKKEAEKPAPTPKGK